MSSGSGQSQCNLCREPFSVLRFSTLCNLCQKRACSSCCRPLPNTPNSRVCVTCSRRQAKAEDPNDDRPKWLREAQDLRKSQPASSSQFSVQSSSKTIHDSEFKTKKQSDNDDRPKWLREAQEQRTNTMTTNAPSSAVDLAGPNQEIESRLAKLKEDIAGIKPILTEDQLTDRMARLRDQDPKAYAASRQTDTSILRPQPRRTEAEEIEELVAQMKERATLDDGDEDLIKELENRLNRLKAETAALGIQNLPLSKNSSPRTRPRDISPGGKKDSPKKQRVLSAMDVDSDEEAERIAKVLTQKLPDPLDSQADDADEEEWFCVICPKDPTVLCLDCENEKYCDRCFRECHREWAAMDHRTKKLPKRKSNYT